MTDRVGQQLGNYRLVALLGQGGYAEVYLGQHVRLNLQAAIKVLHTHLTGQEAEHFQQEAETIAALVHPSIVRVFDFDVQDGVPFLVMDYAPNGSLRRRYPKGTVVPLPQILSTVKQVAAALQYAHDQKFIHRDVKPENMLVGRHEEVLLSDFGLAALAHSTGSLSAQAAVGTLPYMAPEQIEGHPRAASDQYALGVVVYEWLCRARPFEGSATEVMVQQLTMPPPPLHEKVATIPLGIEQVVLHALAKEPKERFTSVQDFASDLEQASQRARASTAQFASEQPVRSPAAAPGHDTVAPSQPDLPTETTPSADLPVGALEPTVYPDPAGPHGLDTPRGGATSETDVYWNVPYRRNPFFTGRGDLLAQLGEQLRSERSAALTQSYALSGLGGIGKTQLAVEYAYRAREQYQAIFWVRAGSRETLLGDFVSIAELLSIPTASVQDQMQIVETVKRRLAEMGGWLLILDNADDLSLLQDFLPAGEGHVLLTTRAQATATIAISIAVEKMDLDEGTLLLLTRAKLLAPFASLGAANAQNLALGRTLVGLLDGLPLALDQAGAYIEESGCDLQEYLTSYRQHRRELLARRGAVAMNYPHSVVSTWALSFQQVEQAKPSAADILRLCAFLDPDAIPERLLAEGAAALGPRLAAVIGDPLQWNEALSVLRQYSLLHRDGERKMLSLHRLVQAVLKDEMEEEERRAWAERVVQAVAAAFPEPLAEHWPRCQQYLPHAQVCAELIAEYHLVTPETSLLLLRSGQYLGERGRYEQAEAFLGRAVAQREQMGGLRQIAQALVQLGHLYLLQGRYEQAEQVLQRALGIDEQELGPEHLATAEALHYLANVYHLRYQYEQAEALYLRVLRLREGAVGESELTVAQTLSDLALHYQYHHHYERAEVVYQRALAMYERVAGPDHPDFVITLHNFGSFYRSQQRYEQAEQVLQRALSLHERVFGPEHPHTGNVLGELGDLCREHGQYEQAEAYLQRALVIKERALGPQHPYTGYALDSLAFLYSRQGRYEQAAGFYRRAAAVLTRDTLRNAIFFYDMACFYDDWCHYEQAEPLLRRSLSIRERDLGPGHPDCMEVRERYERVRLKLKLQT